jgi:hypothetical protein
MRRLVLVPIVLVLLAAPAQAAVYRETADTIPTNLSQTVTTAHFAVHYTDAPGDANASTADGARTLAANAEAVYAIEVGQWGYPAPYDGNGDGRMDLHVFSFDGGLSGAAGVAWFRGYFPAEPIIAIDSRYTTSKSVIAHELFHALQFTIQPWGKWGSEATARWAEHQLKFADELRNDYGYLRHTDTPLDCEYDSCPADVWDGGYERWLFFGYLSDLYGPGVVKELFQDARARFDARRPATTDAQTIDAVLQKHGTTLTRVFGEFAVANVTRSYASVKPSGVQVKTVPLAVSGSAVMKVDVEHLATKYIRIGASGTACTDTSLNVSVTLPTGLGFAAIIVGGASTTLTAAGGTATGTIPWQTCTGQATLVLPNGLLGGAAVSFTVQASVGSAGAGAVPPPASAGARTDPAPTVSLLGLPAVLRVSSRKPVVWISVSSNAPGQIAAALDGGGAIGTFKLGPGTNSVRLMLPRGLKGQRTLVLTSMSAAGTSGQTLRQQILFVR